MSAKKQLKKVIREEIKSIMNERVRIDMREVEMMDGLVKIKDVKMFKKALQGIQRKLYDEGFEYDQIEMYIEALLQDKV